jgi:hypothetical protein
MGFSRICDKPNWTQGQYLELPQGPPAFELEVKRLKLKPAEYASSDELKEWVRKYKNQKYVPLDLLRIWRFEVRADV